MIKKAPEKVFIVFNVCFMVLLCLTIIYPFWQQVVISISPPDEASTIGLHLFTMQATFDSYIRLFQTGLILNAYGWTILRTFLGTLMSLTVTAMMSYALSKKKLWARNFFTTMVVFTMFFGGGLVPSYLVIRNLRLINTIWALVLPGLCSAWDIIIMRNFFQSIPDALEESASIDGANDLHVFFRIIIPLSKPILATVALWNIVGHWNAWFDAMIYLSGNRIVVLQGFLRQMLANAAQMSGRSFEDMLSLMEAENQQYTPESVKAAVLMCVTLPIICVYPFLQKYFVKGLMVGSLKG